MSEYTADQQKAIRRHWSYLELRFRSDGSVDARSGRGRAWGRLYTKADVLAHLQAIGLEPRGARV